MVTVEFNIHKMKQESYSHRNFSIERISLIRSIYRALLQYDRTYAAFDPKHVIPLVEKLASRKVILDPMSGYGSLINFCSTASQPISAFCIEYNAPSYLWQVLINPINAKKLLELSERLMEERNKWPAATVRALSSDDWFPEESLKIIMELWDICYEISGTLHLKNKSKIEIPLAFLMPFVGRLAACVQGNVVTHIKKGGLCIYENWDQDFYNYIIYLRNKLSFKLKESNNISHKSVLGDCMTVKLPHNTFPAMITSPPYPNSRDYASMFGPENAFLTYLESEGIIKNFTNEQRLIGCPCVSETQGPKKTIDDVKSTSAKNFLNKLINFKGTKGAMYDEHVYYLPSLAKYFHELERAYENIAPALKNNFEGYIIVINNTHRKQIIPVEQFLLDTWRRLGFNAEIAPEYTRELSHVGGLNPVVKGLTARHTEYTIRIYR